MPKKIYGTADTDTLYCARPRTMSDGGAGQA
jgi:hypothetical protein